MPPSGGADLPDTGLHHAPGLTRIVVEATTLRLRGLRIDAAIGVLPHEHGRLQPLSIDLDLGIRPVREDRIGATFDYACAAVIAAEIAAGGHLQLVETFAARLAQALLSEPQIEHVRVCIVKPQAMTDIATSVGVELSARRG